MKLVLLTGKAGSGKDTVADILCSRGFTKYSFAAPLKDFAEELFKFPPTTRDGDIKEVPFTTQPIKLTAISRKLQNFVRNQAHTKDVADIVAAFHSEFKPFRKTVWSWHNAKCLITGMTWDMEHTYTVSPRRTWQLLATEVIRKYCPHFWVNLASKYYRDLCDKENLDGTFYIGLVIADCRFNNEAMWGLSRGGKLFHIEREGAKLVGTEAVHSSETVLDEDLYGEPLLNTGTLEDLVKLVNAKI